MWADGQRTCPSAALAMVIWKQQAIFSVIPVQNEAYDGARFCYQREVILTAAQNRAKEEDRVCELGAKRISQELQWTITRCGISTVDELVRLGRE